VSEVSPAALSLLSPPPSPARKQVVRPTSPPSTNTMDRSRYMSAPPAASPGRASGDARSNLAVQPAANTGSLKLKKNAVKIVGAAGPIPTTPSRPVPPTLSVTSSPASGSVKAISKLPERYAFLFNLLGFANLRIDQQMPVPLERPRRFPSRKRV
jgi:hypothetical protein